MAFWIKNLPSRKPIAAMKRRSSLKPKNEEVLRPVEWKLTPTELSLPSSMEEYALVGALRLFVLKRPQWAAWYGLKTAESPAIPAARMYDPPLDTAFTYEKSSFVSASKIESLWRDIMRKMNADSQRMLTNGPNLSDAAEIEEAKAVNGDGKAETEAKLVVEIEEPPELTGLFDEQQAMFDWVGIRSFTVRGLAGYRERQPALAVPETPETQSGATPTQQEQTNAEPRNDNTKTIDRSQRRKNKREKAQISTGGAATARSSEKSVSFDVVDDTEAESEDDWDDAVPKAPDSDRRSKRRRIE